MHNGLHDVVVVGTQSSHGLCPRALDLRHDQLDVLGFDAILVDVAVGLFHLDDGRWVLVCGLNASAGIPRGSELLRRRGLGLRAQVLYLGLAKNDVGVRIWRLVHVRLRNHEQDVFTLFHSHAYDTRQRLQAQLLDSLPTLLLRSVLLRALFWLLAVRAFKVRHFAISGAAVVAGISLNLLNLRRHGKSGGSKERDKQTLSP
mmetsp:Transcript_54092/g.150420  ORF Transcript_54092/g.150420 Transcript_54092/m.150420 type:complete len:202 (+) Transcript_54092:96-701(+)